MQVQTIRFCTLYTCTCTSCPLIFRQRLECLLIFQYLRRYSRAISGTWYYSPKASMPLKAICKLVIWFNLIFTTRTYIGPTKYLTALVSGCWNKRHAPGTNIKSNAGWIISNHPCRYRILFRIMYYYWLTVCWIVKIVGYLLQQTL